MPTGLTYPIVDGEISTVSEFAFLCTTQFVMSRRDGDTELRLHEPDDFYAKSARRAIDELMAWDALDEEGRYAQWSEYVLERKAEAEKRMVDCAVNLVRLNKMRVQIEAIEVPETHKNFKAYMLDQIDMTIESDATYTPKWYKTEDYVTWSDSMRGDLLRNLARYAEGVAEADKRTRKGNEWIKTLASLYNLEVANG